MLAPVGRFQTKDRASPAAKQISEMQADVTTSARKLLTSLRAVTAGRMIRLDIRSVPIILMPSTTVRAVRKEIRN